MSRYLILFAKIGLSVGLAWYALSKVDIGSSLDLVRSVSAATIVIVLLLLSLQLVVAALRLRELLGLLGAHCPLLTAIDVVMIGAFFSQTMISFIGGDAMRIWRIAARGHTSLTVATRSILFDRAAGFVGLIIVILAGLPLMLRIIERPELRIGLLVTVAACVAGFVFFLSLKHMPRVLRRWKVFSWVADFAAIALTLSKSKKGLVALLGLSLAIHLLNVVILYVIARSLEIDLTFIYCLVLMPPVLFMSMLPISIAGWGVREGAMVVALGFVGVPAAQSLALSVCFGLFLLAISLPGGALWLLTRHRRVAAPAGSLPNND